MSPILARHLPILKKRDSPLDLLITYRGKRLFGPSKTWRGLLCGVVVATLVFGLQQKFADNLGNFSNYLMYVHYGSLPIVLGTLLGFGALLGDAVESFFKRQLNLAPGKSWFPFDQLDYIIGGCLASLLVIKLPLIIYGWIIFIWVLVHLISSYVGYLLRFKKAPI